MPETMPGNDSEAVATPRFAVEMARTRAAVAEAQRLRYHVFAEELGATVHTERPGHECDTYDAFCRHLLVRDTRNAKVVACSRILDGETAGTAGGFYSENEFHMRAIKRLPGRLMELGRTCVAPGYRDGATIAALWSGLARHIVEEAYDYLIGCASIPATDGGAEAATVMQRLRRRHMAPDALRVRPRTPLPANVRHLTGSVRMPALLRAYLALGAQVCGEPCWDPEFRVADVFILVDTRSLSARYVRHFLRVDATAIPRDASGEPALPTRS